MDRTWAVVIALLATGCGDALTGGSPPGSDDSGLDGSGSADASGSEGGKSADASGGVDSGSQGDGGSDGGGAIDGGGEGDSGGAVDAGSKDTGDTGDAGWSTVCPANAPAAGSACASGDVQCEYPSAAYGDVAQYAVSCDSVFQCTGGTWSSVSLSPSACVPDGPNAGACPSSFGGLMNGTSCSENGLRCEYPEGVCTCSKGFGGVPVVDAGPTWGCNPGASCPMPRPRIGSPCTTKETCTYETCSFGETCSDGVWQSEPTACAF